MATYDGGTGRTTSNSSNSMGSRRAAATETNIDKARDAAGDYAGEFVRAIKARPYAAAALAASAAGIGALIWAKRAVIGEQASAAGDKISEQAGVLREKATEQAGVLREKATEQAGALRDKVSEQAGALRDKVNEKLSAEAPSTTSPSATFQVDPLLDEQSKVGAVAY